MIHFFQFDTLTGENSQLIIDTSGAGKGALSVSIKAASGQEVTHSIRDIGHGRFEVSYFPVLPVPHKLDVKYNGNFISSR